MRAHRVVGTAIVVLGAYLVVVPFALSLFSRTADAETLSDRYRSFMSEEGLARFDTNLRTVTAGGEELFTDALPRFADDLDMSDAQLEAYIGENFPHVAAMLQRAPEVLAYLTPAVADVVAQKDNFREADAFPLEEVPVTAGPWSLLGLGVLLVAVGLWTRRRPRRATGVVALAVGAALTLGPLALRWPEKVDAADEVAEVARLGFSPEVAATTVDDTYAFDAAIVEMRQAMFPAIGRRLGMSPDETETFVATTFPDLTTFLDEWQGGIYERSISLSLSQTQYMDEFHNADATPYLALPWLFMVPGFLLVAVAGGALLLGTGLTVGRRPVSAPLGSP